MLKINLIAIGDIKEGYLQQAIAEYLKRISRFAELKIIELKENNPASANEKDILSALEKDALNIEKHMKGYPICLDIDAPQFSSEQFSEKIQNLCLKTSEISFIIGASNGIAKRIKDKCLERISFSKMTFPHQLMRVIFLEQIYRAFTIINHIAYHK